MFLFFLAIVTAAAEPVLRELQTDTVHVRPAQTLADSSMVRPFADDTTGVASSNQMRVVDVFNDHP